MLWTARRRWMNIETFILNFTKILREGRRAGAKELCIIGDLNVEWWLLCTDEDDISEFNEMHGPLCWQGCERDHGGFKKLLWYGRTKEFNCKVTSTWSDCFAGRKKWPSRTHNLLITLSEQGGHRTKHTPTMMKNMGRQGPHPIFPAIQQYEASNYFSARRRKQKWTGWRPKKRRSKNWIPESSDVKGRRKAKKKLGNNTQGYWGGCGQSGSQNKKTEDKAVKETPESVRIREEAAARCTKQKESTQEQARKARADHHDECSLMPGRKLKRKPLSELYVNKGKKNCKGIAKWCKRIKMKQETCKRN